MRISSGCIVVTILLTLSASAIAQNSACIRQLSTGENIDDIIAKEGGLQPALNMALRQRESNLRWFADMRESMDQGIAEEQLRQLYAQGEMANRANEQLIEALQCRQ
ncbi:hypothetical protein [Halomonas cupida]|uniref:hypothetical protein n=1 Tax=Halomonas cupida TaxID=44933 RepID=UPI003A93F944